MLRFLLRSGGVAVLLLLAACGGGSGNPAAAAPAMTAKNLATSLSRPSRLLIGLGSTNASDVKAQHLSIDIFDHYLVGAGDSGWPSWNSPRGAYVGVFAAQADSLNAVPMYTLYQMA
ncbi:MAG TPA: hypothetical protein VHE37_07760, partial [Nevskiaceae bacterium]|nr:hypothetical protein [Nevskiaceae bacterium]